MTILVTTTVVCDQFLCTEHIEVYQGQDLGKVLELTGWQQNPGHNERHFCPDCWDQLRDSLED